ncbi:hypothetical protein [Segnochrobactrum spirostomi]|uniref:hypothetical protein n=1 Tax=Segnochrobactrum spirostomi TaxID=2608987 RepID=UPI001294AD89|nr:hypothetical protein [Segnochrobactrum spirostomi]
MIVALVVVLLGVLAHAGGFLGRSGIETAPPAPARTPLAPIEPSAQWVYVTSTEQQIDL